MRLHLVIFPRCLFRTFPCFLTTIFHRKKLSLTAAPSTPVHSTFSLLQSGKDVLTVAYENSGICTQLVFAEFLVRWIVKFKASDLTLYSVYCLAIIFEVIFRILFVCSNIPRTW